MMFHLIVLLLTLHQACGFFRRSEGPNPPWTPRTGAVSWTDGSALFVAAGYASDQYLNDVWTSADFGLSWKPLPSLSYSSIAWASPEGSSAVSFNGTQFVVGGRGRGCDDSPLTWTLQTYNSAYWKVSKNAPVRSYAMMTVWNPPSFSGLESQILLIGGTQCNIGFFNDVWSYDWKYERWLPLGNGKFPELHSAGIATVQQGSQIIMAGGSNGVLYYNTVWSGAYNATSKSLTWIVVCSAAAWSPRSATLVATSNDYLYLVEGVSSSTPRNDVYVSADAGATWSTVTKADSFMARNGVTLQSIGRLLILLGGGSSRASAQNDVWQVWAA